MSAKFVRRELLTSARQSHFGAGLLILPDHAQGPLLAQNSGSQACMVQNENR
jgi:hypothetical protein